MRRSSSEPVGPQLPGWPQSGVPATATSVLCEAFCKVYSDCVAFLYKPKDKYCALFTNEVSWITRGDANSVCPAGETCIVKRK